jgi:hypothetical protein
LRSGGGCFPGTTIAIALEQSKGTLIHALMKYEHLVLYPINPKQLSRYRDAPSIPQAPKMIRETRSCWGGF